MKLGRYRLVAELARGGMGVVWLAEARGPGGFAKAFVVKELAPELAGEEEHRAMFLEEARVAAKLAHRNVVQTLDIACDDGRWFMVLELLEGCSLARARTILGKTRLPIGLAAVIVREMLEGLHHAHERGVVHRDVSAQNVFLTASGEVKLLDFGLARSGDRARRTDAGIVKGSVAYLSPDHVAEATIDRRADVFAAGVLLRELLVGERLWGDAAGGAIVRRLVARDIPPFPEDVAHGPHGPHAVPPALRAICERAMAPVRARRFQTAKEMSDALDAWLATAPRALGTLADLPALFDRELAAERDRARVLLRAHPPSPPPLPVAVTLPSHDLVSLLPPPASSPGPLWRRRDAAFVSFALLVVIFVVGLAVDHGTSGGRADDARAHAATAATSTVVCN